MARMSGVPEIVTVPRVRVGWSEGMEVASKTVVGIEDGESVGDVKDCIDDESNESVVVVVVVELDVADAETPAVALVGSV